MSQSLCMFYVHLIYHIKTTSPIIRNEDLFRVFTYIVTLINSTGCHAIKVGGIGDHVHILFQLSKDKTIVSIVKDIKANSSRWLRELDPYYKSFAWQTGYGAFSVSQSLVEKTSNYIEHQKEHHSRKSFKEEYLAFLNLYEVQYDERYLFTD